MFDSFFGSRPLPRLPAKKITSYTCPPVIVVVAAADSFIYKSPKKASLLALAGRYDSCRAVAASEVAAAVGVGDDSQDEEDDDKDDEDDVLDQYVKEGGGSRSSSIGSGSDIGIGSGSGSDSGGSSRSTGGGGGTKKRIKQTRENIYISTNRPSHLSEASLIAPHRHPQELKPHVSRHPPSPLLIFPTSLSPSIRMRRRQNDNGRGRGVSPQA